MNQGIGMLRRVRRLRSIGAHGDAIGQLAQAGHELRDVVILRVIRDTPQVPDGWSGRCRSGNPAGRPDLLDDRYIVFRRPIASSKIAKKAIGNDCALQRLVLVMMCGDESRHDDHAAHLGVRTEVGAYRDDLLALDQHVGSFEIADGRIERQYDAVLDQDAAVAILIAFLQSIEEPVVHG